VAWAADFSVRNLDILGYLLPGFAVLVIWACLGTFSLFEVLRSRLQSRKWQAYAPALALVILLLPVFQAARNYKSNDHSQNYYVYEYGQAVLDQVPSGSVIVIGEDNTLTPLWYLTLVEHYRSDVLPVAWNAVENLDSLKNLKFQRPNLSIPARLTKPRWVEKFAQLNPRIPLFVQYADLPSDIEKNLVPQQYLLRYSNGENAQELKSQNQKQDIFLEQLFSRLEKKSDFDLGTEEHYGNLFFNWGVYFDRHGSPEQSFLNFNRALQIDQTNDRYYTALGRGFLKSGRIKEAEKFFLAAMELNPFKQDNYEYLRQCQNQAGGKPTSP